MRPTVTRLLTLTICATAVAMIAVVTADQAEASSRKVRTHHQRTNLGWSNSWRRARAAQDVRPAAPSWSGGGNVCPGLARSFDCKIWPPPFEDDPDRKHSGSDAGG